MYKPAAASLWMSLCTESMIAVLCIADPLSMPVANALLCLRHSLPGRVIPLHGVRTVGELGSLQRHSTPLQPCICPTVEAYLRAEDDVK